MSLIKKPLRLRIILNLIQKEGIKMKKGLIELVFILDRSGSMRGLEADTVGGFNSLIEKQKQTPGEALVSLVLFDDQFEVVHHRRKIETLEALTKGTYYVRGSTALVDAVGRGIEKSNTCIINWVKTTSRKKPCLSSPQTVKKTQVNNSIRLA
jgi:hypothetical protein